MSESSEFYDPRGARDVSERRATEEERIAPARERAAHAGAEADRERLASILAEIDAIIWESDGTGRTYSFVSPRAEEILGYPRERWLEEPYFWRVLVHPDDVDVTSLALREAIAEREHVELEYRVRAADGRTVTVRDRIRITRTEGGGLRLRGVMVDMTSRLDLEERLLQSQKMEAVGQLAGGVAHDFNNLLTVITGYVNLVRARVDDETSRSHLGEITRAAARAAELTSQLLAFSRRAPSRSELIELDDLLLGIEPMLRRLIDEDIALTIDRREPEPVQADRGQLEQVVVNLVVNARDAMPAGGEIRVATGSVDLDATAAAVHGLAPGRYSTLLVADTGSGMRPETQARMFEPFFTTKAHGKGTGLGLATVFGIVEQTGGKILVDSTLGQGTTITVLLPASQPAEISAGESGELDEAATVLVVEDEEALRTLARLVLQEHGYRVFDVGNGREAIDFVERHRGRLDVVLTDVVMPDVNGPELVARLEKLRPETRVLYMSGYADSRLINRGVAEGRVKILRKPFETDDLAARVAELVAGTEGGGSGS
jgi:PAS domain S-box-containing protein